MPVSLSNLSRLASLPLYQLSHPPHSSHPVLQMMYQIISIQNCVNLIVRSANQDHFFPTLSAETSIIFRYYSLQLRNSQPLPHNFHLTFSLLNEFASFFKAKIHKIRSNISPHTFTIYSTLRTHISNQIVLRTQCLNSIRSIQKLKDCKQSQLHPSLPCYSSS